MFMVEMARWETRRRDTLRRLINMKKDKNRNKEKNK